jgi:hypothetical protein
MSAVSARLLRLGEAVRPYVDPAALVLALNILAGGVA